MTIKLAGFDRAPTLTKPRWSRFKIVFLDTNVDFFQNCIDIDIFINVMSGKVHKIEKYLNVIIFIFWIASQALNNSISLIGIISPFTSFPVNNPDSLGRVIDDNAIRNTS